MARFTVKSLIPFFAPILLFAVVCSVYFMPLFQGKTISQGDIIQFTGMSKEINDYRDKTGDEPLWTNSMFSGMPALNISFRPSGTVSRYLNHVFALFFPRAAAPMFIAMVGLYLLMLVFGAPVWTAALAGIAYGLASFLLISIEAGHNTKTHCMAYMPLVIAGIVMAYRGKIILGGVLTMLFLSIQIFHGHIQVIYYTMLLTIVLVVTFAIVAFREHKLPDFIKASLVLAGAAMIAIGPNSTKLLNTYVYGQETMRGGSSELSAKAEQKKGGGLDYDYATRWSQGKMETFTLLIPYFRGGGSENIGESSAMYEALVKRGFGEQQAAGMVQRAPTYWGDQPFTSGALYIGAIVCFLFVLGMFSINNPLKWGLFAVFILSLLLAWGKYSIIVYDLFFDFVPMFNKFRTPAMALALTGLIVPIVGFWGLKEWLSDSINKTTRIKMLKMAGGITLGVILVLGMGGQMFYDFESENDQRIEAQYAQAGGAEFGKTMVNALREDRASMLMSDSFRSFILVLLAAGMMWAFATGKLKEKYLMVALGILIVGDLWQVDKRYLNTENFVSEGQYQRSFLPTQADLQIKKDPDPHFRVFNTTRDPFNDALTSYHHKSVGGYHPAKLIKYQDMIDHHIGKNNMDVFNMLNTKYFIVNDKQSNRPTVQQNPLALGNAWFVNKVNWVENADQEITALSSFDPGSEVVIDQRFEDYLAGYNFSKGQKSANIQLSSYDPKLMTYQSNSSTDQFAVFSEIFYRGNEDWKAYIDGNFAEHIRVNYILRGMKIPAGQHRIEFKFEPEVVALGETISLASSVVLVILLVGGLGWSVYRKR